MLLEEFRQEILEEHEMEQRRIQEESTETGSSCGGVWVLAYPRFASSNRPQESLLLRWKVERLRSAEPLRKLYALEAENGPVEPMVISAPRRIDVEEAWKVTVEGWKDAEQKGWTLEHHTFRSLQIILGRMNCVISSAFAIAKKKSEDHRSHPQLISNYFHLFFFYVLDIRDISRCVFRRRSFPPGVRWWIPLMRCKARRQMGKIWWNVRTTHRKLAKLMELLCRGQYIYI